MAERRMFAKTIIDSDAFLDMPCTSQLLYFHLAMRADDDGFINNPKAIMRNVGCKDDDVKLLSAKKFIIPFESGVVVIKHWKVHNYIQNDRYHETKYSKLKSSLSLDENRAYTLPEDGMYPVCIQDVSNMDTEVRLGKDSIGKVRLGKESIEARPRFTPPTIDEVEAYCRERKNNVNAQKWFDHYTSNGWKVGKNSMKDWKAAVRTWEEGDKQKKPGRFDALLAAAERGDLDG